MRLGLHHVHFLAGLAGAAFVAAQLAMPWLLATDVRRQHVPETVRANPSSYQPHYAPTWVRPSGGSGGWGGGK
jgi:hypothetical protein